MNRLDLEKALTPVSFADFVGQDKVKARLELAIQAAKMRATVLDHVLLFGPSGVGKTTLAYLAAKVMCVNITPTSASAITKLGDFAGLLTKLEKGDVLYVEEIHRLRTSLVEHLASAATRFQLDIVIDQGPNAQRVRLNLPSFTLIGATDSPEQVPDMLLSCFSIKEEFSAYSASAIAVILERAASALEITMDRGAIDLVSESSGGMPHGAVNLLKRVYDYSLVKMGAKRITAEIARDALYLLLESKQVQPLSSERIPIPSEIRKEVWRRDSGKCAKCGSRERLEYDHIIPVSKGGSNTARNIELLCETCNRSKSHAIQ